MVGAFGRVLGAGLAAAILGAPVAQAQDVGQIIGMGAPLVMQMMRGAQTGEREVAPPPGYQGKSPQKKTQQSAKKTTKKPSKQSKQTAAKSQSKKKNSKSKRQVPSESYSQPTYSYTYRDPCETGMEIGCGYHIDRNAGFYQMQ